MYFPFQDSINEITKLLEKQTNFERLLAKQEERFNALERLTTYELRSARQKQMEAARREKEEKERLGLKIPSLLRKILENVGSIRVTSGFFFFFFLFFNHIVSKK